MFSFLQQGFLWLLAAALLPVMIHLMNRRRHRTVPWAAMNFLLKATKESRGQKRLKHIIILACRTLAIIAIALVAARPLLGGLFGWNGGSIDTVVLILDRSASMELSPEGDADSKRASVIARVRNSLSEIGNPRLVLLDSANKKVQDISSPDILEELSFTQPTDSSANIPDLIIKAVDYITEQKLGKTEIWLASDLQASDWKHNESSWASARSALDTLEAGNQLRILALLGKPKANTSIQITSSRRVQNELVLEIELQRNSTSAPKDVITSFNINGAVSSTPLTIQGQTMVLQKRFELDTGIETGHGYVSITPDANPQDNVAYFAFGEAKPSHAIVVSEPGESKTALMHAAALPGIETQNIRAISPDDWQSTEVNQSALVLWQAQLPQKESAKKLTTFLNQGGVVVLLPTSVQNSDSYQGISWGDSERSADNMFFVISNWNKSDGPLKDGSEGVSIPLQKLKAIRRTAIQGDASQLATWDDESPFLSRKFVGRGTIYILSTLPDYSWSNLESGDILVPFIQRSLQLGTLRFGSGFAANVGSDRALPLLGETRVRVDDYSTNASANADVSAGVWKFGDRLIATNRPPSEDNPEIISANTLDSLLKESNYTLFEDSGSQENSSFAQEIWQAILVGMLIFLIIEAILCLQPKRNLTIA